MNAVQVAALGGFGLLLAAGAYAASSEYMRELCRHDALLLLGYVRRRVLPLTALAVMMAQWPYRGWADVVMFFVWVGMVGRVLWPQHGR